MSPVLPDCSGKQPFPTRALAVKVTCRARRNKRRRDKDDWHPEPYRCPHCRCWHLGRKKLF